MYLSVEAILILCAAVSVMGLILTEKEEKIVESLTHKNK